MNLIDILTERVRVAKRVGGRKRGPGTSTIEGKRSKAVEYLSYTKSELLGEKPPRTMKSKDRTIEHPTQRLQDGAIEIRIGAFPKFVGLGPRKIWYYAGETVQDAVKFVDDVILRVQEGQLDDKLEEFFKKPAKKQ